MEVEIQREEDVEGRDVQHLGQILGQQVPKDRRKNMRTHKFGAVEACWNFFEFRHKDILQASLWGSSNIGSTRVISGCLPKFQDRIDGSRVYKD